MQKRTRYTLLLLFAFLAALALALFLKKETPPKVARLLPESDAIVYVDLKSIRSTTHFDREWSKRPVALSPEYQHFISATGILFERDLDAVAFALHRMDDPNGPNGPVAYSEVFQGRFDEAKLAAYLTSIAVSKESYAGHDIYTVPVALVEVLSQAGLPAEAVRLLRITQLGRDTLAASNTPTAEQIHSMLERDRASASLFSGSSLLGARYRDVPLLSTLWAIGHVGLPFAENGKISAFGLQLPLTADTSFVASLRFTTSLKLRIDELLPTQAAAEQSANALSALLQLLRSIQDLQSQLNPSQQQRPSQTVEVKELLDSMKIVAGKDRATLTATVPVDILKQLTAATP